MTSQEIAAILEVIAYLYMISIGVELLAVAVVLICHWRGWFGL